MQCVGRVAYKTTTRAKSLSSAKLHNSANVAVSAEQSPELLHRRMNASILSVSVGCMSEVNPCARAVSEFGKDDSGENVVKTFGIHSMCSQCLQSINCLCT